MSKRKETEWNRRNISKNIPKLMIHIDPWIQIAQRTLSRINSKISIPRDIRFKRQKTEDKEKILKEGRRKQTKLTNKEQEKELQQTSHQKTRKQKEYKEIFMMLKEKYYKPRILHPV